MVTRMTRQAEFDNVCMFLYEKDKEIKCAVSA